MDKMPVLKARSEYSKERIGQLKDKVREISELVLAPKLCIYVTGSYGRFEASQHSDLDLFFIYKGSEEEAGIPRVNKTLIDASLIKLCQKLGFREFTGGGRYLDIHYLGDIQRVLGSPADDYKNLFTARLLLLLESVPVHNEVLYDEIVKEIIAAYYRDYHDHEKDFHPVFLVNDIIRYWKTMCLNYEHRRNRPSDDEAKRNENHLKNLKLKFSRVLTCYSTIMVLAKNQEVVTPDAVFDLVHHPPLVRLRQVAEKVDGGDELLDEILDDYSWFLEATGKPQTEVLTWIADRTERNAAFDRARNFGGSIYRLLKAAAEGTETFRYLVI